MGSESFSWVVDGVIGGMSQPGVIMSVPDDLVQLRENWGIGVLVSLTERGLDGSTVEQAGLSYVHLPVVDFTPPSQEALDRVVELARRTKQTDGAVAVHCAAGMGRTGTALAAVMVGLTGLSADDAVRFVRKARPGSIETPEQERAVHDYATRFSGGREEARNR